MKKSIFEKGKKYTFKDYFNFSNPTHEIVTALGYQFSIEMLAFPMVNNIDEKQIETLNNRFFHTLKKVRLNSEMAKRDFMISPLLSEIITISEVNIDVEYPIEVNHLLGGLLDYFIRAEQEIIIIEAKKGDLDRGFTQLSVELIALDQYEEPNLPEILYGIVSIGDIWKFGTLQRKTKIITKDIYSYRIPEDTEKLFKIILGILQNKPKNDC